MTGRRLEHGGQIDRAQALRFRFDGRALTGHPGDTLASALLANGVRLVGRSFKYHRPRGILSAGPEEPNALVTLRSGARAEPNTRATVAELFDGLTATSQNRWPSLRFDALAINDLAAPLLGAGFYYKTFMWPAAFWERVYEPLIRRAAGLGRLSGAPDPDAYDKGFLHADLLVIGAGPAGLAAALAAGRAGARVVLADEDFRMGGRLNAETFALGDTTGADWAAAAVAELAGMAHVRLLPRTTVFGAFDHGIYGAVERVADHLPDPPPGTPRQILWRITTRRTILAAGATERPIAFADNDRPGVMLAGSLRAYANRWGVAPGKRVAVFTNNDDGLRTARDLRAHGVRVAAVIDARPDAPDPRIDGARHLPGAVVIGTSGRLGLTDVTVRTADGREFRIDCDALGVSGGWNPALHLTCHQRGRPVWDDRIAAFAPGPDLPPGMAVAGAAAGVPSTHGALHSGHAAAAEALDALGRTAPPADLPQAEDAPLALRPLWHVPGTRRAWLDLQNDVTVKDIAQAQHEGFGAVEHMKRYTTLGMATDQGKIANVPALGVMAELTGRSIAETGTTIFRPPYTPVSLGALGGRATGPTFKPTRLTPTHPWAEAQGAVFVEVGQWLRAQYFPRAGETHWRQSVDREVLAVRAGVGLCDVTTLGKIDIQGTDAARFVNRVYCNGFARLAVGRVRYGLMLREDGIVMDDGTTARLAEDHFVMTTTTANAGPVFRHLEFARQCLWPDLDVQLISTTDAWAQIAVAGPKSRTLLQRVIDPGHDISNAAFPFMACGAVTVCGGLRARLFRISFSGELAYELAVPARYGNALMERLMERGADLGATPYGTEALSVLRIEKGHAAGGELDGRTTAQNLRLGRMVSTKKDSIGAVAARRPGLNTEDTLELVGLRARRPDSRLAAGSHLFAPAARTEAANDLGWVSSAAFSPHLGAPIALAFLRGGAARQGEVLRAVNLLSGQDTEVEVTSPHFIDPDGERLRA